jgi:hypothetical protein
MRRRPFFGVLVVVMLVAMLPGVASANGDPVGGCPPGTTHDGPDPEANGWSLVPVESSIDQDRGNLMDQNGDGYVCQRFNYGLRLKYHRTEYSNPPEPILGDCCGYWAAKDNTHRIS